MLSPILSDTHLSTLRQLVATARHIVICGHKSPDGDAIGAALGWKMVLRAMGKEAQVVMPDAMPDFLRWLPEADTVKRHDRHPVSVETALRRADLIFCLDFNTESRVDGMEPALRRSRARKVMIDHHLAPSLERCALTVSHPDMSSTCELVFRITHQLGVFPQMTTEWATAIYCGMMTDTGGFTYNSSRPEIYAIISLLLTKNIDKDRIYRQVNNVYSADALRLRGYIISEKMHVADDLHASYYAITRDDMTRFHFIRGDAEGLVNEPLRIKGHRLSISLREDTERDNLVLVSVRSVDDFPANELAARFFNGGGHLNAAGGRLYCSIAEAEAVAQKAIEAYADRLRA